MFGRVHKIERLDFIVAGAQKSGTTALHYFLQKHPKITMGDQQEIHFFDDEEIFAAGPDYERLHRHYPPVSRGVLAGDCTPVYLYWPPAAERIASYHPGIKLVVVLRNPVERAFAHWNMQRHKKREPFDFLAALAAEPKRLENPRSVEARRYSYVARGRYVTQLERFFRLFPRRQMKIIKFEDFQQRQRETLDSVFAFLGVTPPRAISSKDRNVVPYEREMTAEERQHLQSIFANEILELERLLGWDCSDWRKS